MGQERGKLSSIGRVEERLVFLLRGCDHFQVALCPAAVGKELFHALKTAGAQARPQLRALKFPATLSNRHCYGIAALQIGGKDLKQVPDYALSAADFPLVTEEEFDAFASPPDHKLEKRPRAPVTLSAWFRCALREAWALACAYGEEHYPEWEEAASYLLRLGEEQSFAWSAATVMGLWEELWARYAEELRELDRRLRREMREESPTFERIRFYATAPGPDGNPWLRLPGTFRLDDPNEFFQLEVIPRHNRLLSRACWSIALRRSPRRTPGWTSRRGRRGNDPRLAGYPQGNGE